MTVHQRVAAARERLRAAGIPDAEADLDARLLAERVLDWDTARFFADGGMPEPPGFGASYERVLRRREAREPIAYIVGGQEFWGLPFVVGPGVLIPRPETELLVEVALETFPPDRPFVAADVCTGSGCIAVAIAHERPAAHLLAMDLSTDALAVARLNAANNDVAARVEFRQADLLDGVDARFDLIVSNPPYVRSGERSMLQPEVRDHEPATALFGGGDGLDIIRRLVPSAAARLAEGGTLIFEFGFGQDFEVEQLIRDAPSVALVELRRDLQGIARAAVVRKVHG